MRRIAWLACLLLGGCELIDHFHRFSFDAEVARIEVGPDLVGFATTLDGSGSISPDATAVGSYGWHFTQVPAGSKVDDSALSSSAEPKPRFEPDLGGDYTIELTVTSVGGTRARGSRTFTVPTVPVFYYEGIGEATAQELGVGVLRSDGSGRHLVSCPILPSGANGGPITDPLSGLRFAGMWGLRAHYPASGAALVVFLEAVPAGGDGGTVGAFRLWSADEGSSCVDRPPVQIDRGVLADHAHLLPRVAPDASRVAWLDLPQEITATTTRVATVSLGGTAQHTVRANARLHSVPPVWLDATHLAWVEDLSTTNVPHLVVYSAPDMDRAGDAEPPTGGRTTLLDCGAMLVRINQVAVLPDGDLIVAGAERTPSDGQQPGSFQLYRMKPGACALDRVIAPEPPLGYAWDFDVSPDGKSVVFSGGIPPRDIYLVPADGSAAPARLVGDPAREDLGPRFVAGGRQVVWTQTTGVEPPTGGGVMIANLDGSHARSLYAEGPLGGGGRVRVIAGSNLGTSCAYGDGVRAGSGLMALAVVLFALLAGRARRRRAL